MKRFSKQTLATFVNMHMTLLEAEFKFTPEDGWNQVKGRQEEVQRAYGRYSQLQDLASHFDLFSK